MSNAHQDPHLRTEMNNQIAASASLNTEITEIKADVTLSKVMSFKVRHSKPLNGKRLEEAFAMFWNENYGPEADLVGVVLTAVVDGEELVFRPDEQKLDI